ncbi:MAG: hypothetical protein DRO87_02710 [Candidatus Thorarchaeota archaeon]|nr:MAG: hypothetical protein DRP09_10125 [Candidatus Thorarchaeota archaeon]RLI59524.1 MAG: hypothetical protein DRO87_02710 [Candidatus Thorarchaeota archaeon]
MQYQKKVDDGQRPKTWLPNDGLEVHPLFPLIMSCAPPHALIRHLPEPLGERRISHNEDIRIGLCNDAASNTYDTRSNTALTSRPIHTYHKDQHKLFHKRVVYYFMTIE